MQKFADFNRVQIFNKAATTDGTVMVFTNKYNPEDQVFVVKLIGHTKDHVFVRLGGVVHSHAFIQKGISFKDFVNKTQSMLDACDKGE